VQLKAALNLTSSDNLTAIDVQNLAAFRDDTCVDPYNILSPVGTIEICVLFALLLLYSCFSNCLASFPCEPEEGVISPLYDNDTISTIDICNFFYRTTYRFLLQYSPTCGFCASFSFPVCKFNFFVLISILVNIIRWRRISGVPRVEIDATGSTARTTRVTVHLAWPRLQSSIQLIFADCAKMAMTAKNWIW
jgi:hypothetical protein